MERGHKLFAKDHNRRRKVNQQAEQMHTDGSDSTTATDISTASDPTEPQALYKLHVEQGRSFRQIETMVNSLLPAGHAISYGKIRTRIIAYAKANNLPLPNSKQRVKGDKQL